jgi:hypothetical protein
MPKVELHAATSSILARQNRFEYLACRAADHADFVRIAFYQRRREILCLSERFPWLALRSFVNLKFPDLELLLTVLPMRSHVSA